MSKSTSTKVLASEAGVRIESGAPHPSAHEARTDNKKDHSKCSKLPTRTSTRCRRRSGRSPQAPTTRTQSPNNPAE